jgi:fluoride exporter
VSVLLWTCVALVSGAGATFRFQLHTAVQRRAGTGVIFPVGTLAVNATGSLSLGVLHGAGVGGDAALLLGTALLGSFTTFSTWMVESERLGERGKPGLAALNVTLSLAVGLAAATLGWAVAAAL